MRRPIIIAVASVCLVVAILLWRGLAPSDPVGLSNVRAMPVMGEPGDVHVSLTIEAGEQPDVLISVSSPVAAMAELVFPDDKDKATIPARSMPSLSEDSVYLRLAGLDGPLTDGRLIPITLTFLRSGALSVRARVSEELDPHARHRAMAAMAEAGEIGPAPELDVMLETAANGATLVLIETENFTFAPETEEPEHVAGEGHGHLYLDGLKLQRMYENQALIGALPPGEYEVRVELNTNLHVPYLGPDGPVIKTVPLVVE